MLSLETRLRKCGLTAERRREVVGNVVAVRWSSKQDLLTGAPHRTNSYFNKGPVVVETLVTETGSY